MRTKRFGRDDAAAVSHSEILIPVAFGPVLAHIFHRREPIFALIKEHFHESIAQILQVVCAVRIHAREAAVLGVPADSPGLEISRRYL